MLDFRKAEYMEEKQKKSNMQIDRPNQVTLTVPAHLQIPLFN